MTTKRTDQDPGSAPKAGQASESKTVSASKVGLSLTISNKALKEFDRIQEQATKAAEKIQKFSWR